MVVLVKYINHIKEFLWIQKSLLLDAKKSWIPSGTILKRSIVVLRDILQSLDDIGAPRGLMRHISRELVTF